MVDLLHSKFSLKKDKKTNDFNTNSADEEKSDEELKEEEGPENDMEEADLHLQNVDLKAYKDPEGLSIWKLKLGLWLVKNRRNIFLLFYTFLMMVNILLWSVFVLNFGTYVAIGMKKDQAIFNELLSENLYSQHALYQVSAKQIEVSNVQKIRNKNGIYNFIVYVKNKNPNFYTHFDYYFESNGQKTKLSSGFILPSQSKYILTFDENTFEKGRKINFIMDNIKWTRLDRHLYPDWNFFKKDHLNIKISQIEYTPPKLTHLSEHEKISTLSFKIFNATPYNYYDVNFIVLFFSGNKIIDSMNYLVDTFYSEEEKEISLVIPGLDSRVDDIKIYPEIDITRNDIYIDFDGGPGEPK